MTVSRGEIIASADQPAGTASRSRLRVCGYCLAGFLLWFLLDAAVFRSNLYPSILEPESSAGNCELMFWNETHRKPSGLPEVAVIGNSRLPLLPRISNELTAQTGYRFANAGVAGSSPRCWYYLVRDLDPTTRRYAAIAFAVDDYDDEDTWWDDADSLLDLYKIIARLRLSDVLEFSRSFRSTENRWLAFRGSLFKGFTYQRDLYAFLRRPKDRVANVRWQRRESAGWIYDYNGEARSLEGISVDWATRKITYPAGLPQPQRQVVEDIVQRPAFPQTGRLGAYQRFWLGKIIDRYRNSDTRIVFLRLPRGPIRRPDLVRKKSSSIRELASRRNVILCDEHAFDSLERLELFMDPMHMNGKGMRAFSEIMAGLMAQTLGPGRKPGS